MNKKKEIDKLARLTILANFVSSKLKEQKDLVKSFINEEDKVLKGPRSDECSPIERVCADSCASVTTTWRIIFTANLAVKGQRSRWNIKGQGRVTFRRQPPARPAFKGPPIYANTYLLELVLWNYT